MSRTVAGPGNGSAALVRLFHHRWAVPVLAGMAARGGGRVAELTHELGASRGGVLQALESLLDRGLVARNVGHGHPLRPEYLLTARGRQIVGQAERIVRLACEWSIEDAAFRKWPLPVVYGMGASGGRYSELRARLPGITDRALSGALHSLEGVRLADRIVHPGWPPGVEYHPTERAEALLPSLRRLAAAA